MNHDFLRRVAPRLAPLFLGTLLAACGGAASRSLIQVDVTLAEPGITIDSVEVTATPTSGAAVSRSFNWADAMAGVLKAGVYLSVEGAVEVRARGLLGGQPVAQSEPKSVTLVTGEATAPVALILSRTLAGGGDGGADAGADGARADGGVSDAGPSVDGGASDGGADRGPDMAVTDAVVATPDAVVTPDAPTVMMWKPAENIENDVIDSSYRPHVAIDPVRGHALVVWVEDTAVKVRRYDAVANTWNAIKVLENRGTPYDAHVGIDAAGKAIVSWYQGYDAAAGLPGVWVTHSTDQMTWTPPARIATGRIFHDLPLAVARNGTARIAWEHSENNINTLWSAYYDGTSWTMPSAPVKVGDDSYEREPQIAIDANGSGIIMWGQDDEMRQDSVWAATFAGATVAAPMLVDDYTADSVYVGSVAVNLDGRGMIAYVHRVPSGPTAELWARQYVPATGWSAPQKVRAFNWVSDPKLAIDRMGNTTMLVSQPITGGRDNVFALRLPLGGAWTDLVPLETENKAELRTDQDQESKVTVDAAGNAYALWKRRDDAADLHTFSVWTARYTTTGGWGAAIKLGGKTKLKAFVPHLATADNGLSIATFYYGDPAQTGDKDAWNVFAAIFR